MPQDKTRIAFDAYRASRSLQPIHVGAPRCEGDSDQMSAEDGLHSWEDGSASASAVRGDTPVIASKPDGRHLWVVIAEDVVHAEEDCPFGRARAAGAVKHSNLTGGADAFSGGEIVFLDDHTVVLNGCSGRYRIRSEAEMRAVASAFRKSGYRVWSMGWNADVSRPALFGTQDPEWVAA
jgi:hypothetical protein